MVFVRDLQRPVPSGIPGRDLRLHCLGMADDGSEVFDNNANVKTFLDVKVIKVLTLERY